MNLIAPRRFVVVLKKTLNSQTLYKKQIKILSINLTGGKIIN